jgi:hypothetical protein
MAKIKFIQIAVNVSGEGPYALDSSGNVWRYYAIDRFWVRLSMETK